MADQPNLNQNANPGAPTGGNPPTAKPARKRLSKGLRKYVRRQKQAGVANPNVPRR